MKGTRSVPGPLWNQWEICAWDVHAGVNSQLPSGQWLTPTLPPGQETPPRGCCEGPPGEGELAAGTWGPITQSGSSGWFLAGAPSTEPPYNCLLNAEQAKANRAHESVIRTKMCNVYRALIHHLLLQSNRDHEVILTGSFQKNASRESRNPSFYYHNFFFLFFFLQSLSMSFFCDILKLRSWSLLLPTKKAPTLIFWFCFKEKNANTENI